MGHVPDHTPAAAAAEHAALIVALDAGDLAGPERDRAMSFAVTCPGCTSLLADLAVLRAATATLPATPRTRDYRLTDTDAARLRPSTWGRLVGWLGAPRSTVRPLAGGLAALGIAGLLLSTTPGFSGQTATTLSMNGAPVTAPVEAGGAQGGGTGELRLGSAPSMAPNPSTGPADAATAEPPSTPMPSTPGAPYGAASLPVPSLAAVALPVATAAPSAGALTGPDAAIPGPSGVSSGAGAMDSVPKAATPEASAGERSAALAPASPPATPDRTLPLLLSIALLVAGFGLLLANRVLRHRAKA